MKTFLTVALILLGIVFILSVLMMNPKGGGLGMGMGGASAAGGNDYGSKKSLEFKLKIVATVCAIAFVLVAIILPYIK